MFGKLCNCLAIAGLILVPVAIFFGVLIGLFYLGSLDPEPYGDGVILQCAALPLAGVAVIFFFELMAFLDERVNAKEHAAKSNMTRSRPSGCSCDDYAYAGPCPVHSRPTDRKGN